mmetsp:Transcript_57369/g.78240  ORF Transcript_57369/g.78240 Transcript_57369/m.78240 type:complete len:115 (-) Transcript_57369:973-1317(-)
MGAIILVSLKKRVQTDGADGQFQGEANYGQIGHGAVGPEQVFRQGIIDTANHGKNVSDPALGRLKESVASNHEVLPGSRNCVLYMSQYQPTPAASEQKKPTTWSPRTPRCTRTT